MVPPACAGAVKITPAHDPNDFATGKRHNLPSINILTPEGAINDCGGHFAGQPRFKARCCQIWQPIAASWCLVLLHLIECNLLEPRLPAARPSRCHVAGQENEGPCIKQGALAVHSCPKSSSGAAKTGVFACPDGSGESLPQNRRSFMP